MRPRRDVIIARKRRRLVSKARQQGNLDRHGQRQQSTTPFGLMGRYAERESSSVALHQLKLHERRILTQKSVENPPVAANPHQGTRGEHTQKACFCP